LRRCSKHAPGSRVKATGEHLVERARASMGGIGKGYAVDRAVGILRGRGFRDFMIQAGGDTYVAGHRGDRPWRLGIRDPRGPRDRSFAELDLSNGTFSTSGDYERFFMKDGRRYHQRFRADDGTADRPESEGRERVDIQPFAASLAHQPPKGGHVRGGEQQSESVHGENRRG
jgi:hypothetical protein